MKVSFNYTYDDYRKYLFKDRKKNNIILFIVGILIYLFFTYNKISLIFLPLAIIGLLVAIFLLSVLYIKATIKLNEMLNNNVYGKYTLELTPNKFSVTINNKKTDYKYKQIKKITERKNDFKLKFNKSREFLLFEKKFFKENDYTKIIEMFKEKIQS